MIKARTPYGWNERVQSPRKVTILRLTVRGEKHSCGFYGLDTPMVQEWNIFMVTFSHFYVLLQYLCLILRYQEFQVALPWKN